MQNAPGAVLHVVSASVPDDRRAVLHALLECASGPSLLQVGHGAPPRDLPRMPRLRALFDQPVFGAAALRRRIEALRPAIVHAWSPAALRWVVLALAALHRRSEPVFGAHPPLLCELDLARPLERAAELYHTAPRSVPLALIAPAEAIRAQLVRRGVAPERVAVIPDLVDRAALAAAAREPVREALRLEPDHFACVVLPPYLNDRGPLLAVWGALLAQQIRPQVRILLSDVGERIEPIRVLVRTAKHFDLFRFVAGRFGLPELLAAADLALHLPSRRAPLATATLAAAAACPLVLPDHAAQREAVGGCPAWFCERRPKSAAQAIVAAIDTITRRAETRGARPPCAMHGLSPAEIRARYAAVYEDLVSGRAIGAPVEESAAHG
jgi:glycosyltransferase involved in cell wall biosynthesis